LSALFGADARVSAGGIDQRQHRDAEPVGHLHQPRGLAVAFWPGHAEVVLDAALRVRTLLVAEDADAAAAEAAEAADDGGVLAEFAIAGEWHEIGDQAADVVETVRPLRMAGDL